MDRKCCPDGRRNHGASAPVVAGRYLLLITYFLFWQASQLQAAEDATSSDARRLLRQMTQAMKTLDYQGTVVYLRDNRVDTHKVFHTNEDGVEQERMVALNSPMREIIRDSDLVTCYFPDSKTIIERRPAQRSLLVNLPDNIDSLTDYYKFMLGPMEYVVQRETQVVSIEPKDSYRYGRLIWIDRETKLPLKFELLDEKREPLEQMIFTSISTEDVSPVKQVSSTAQAEILNRKAERIMSTSTGDRQRWRFRSLPDGFRQVFHLQRKKPGWPHTVDHIMLSDGFASVSVYIDPDETPLSNSHKRTMGAIHSAVRQVQGHRVTVLGEVPQRTVDWIASALTEGLENND